MVMQKPTCYLWSPRSELDFLTQTQLLNMTVLEMTLQVSYI